MLFSKTIENSFSFPDFVTSFAVSMTLRRVSCQNIKKNKKISYIQQLNNTKQVRRKSVHRPINYKKALKILETRTMFNSDILLILHYKSNNLVNSILEGYRTSDMQEGN